jgi:hypothetical protein
MPVCYYRLLPAVVASLSLLVSGCGPATPTIQSDAAVAELPNVNQQASTDDGMDTEGTIWTLLGIAKKPPHPVGLKTGPGVSPELWQAVIETLSFTSMDSLDPRTGLAVTEWYMPKDKPNERLRVTAFVKARALRSDSIVVTVERQTRTPDGKWQDATVDRKVAENLEIAILQRAREVHIARLRMEQ